MHRAPRCTVLRPGVALRIADVATAQIACFPTVASLFTLLCALSANATLRTAFEFLARWPDLSLVSPAAHDCCYG